MEKNQFSKEIETMRSAKAFQRHHHNNNNKIYKIKQRNWDLSLLSLSYWEWHKIWHQRAISYTAPPHITKSISTKSNGGNRKRRKLNCVTIQWFCLFRSNQVFHLTTRDRRKFWNENRADVSSGKKSNPILSL